MQGHSVGSPPVKLTTKVWAQHATLGDFCCAKDFNMSMKEK
jgi:hypothetical protein